MFQQIAVPKDRPTTNPTLRQDGLRMNVVKCHKGFVKDARIKPPFIDRRGLAIKPEKLVDSCLGRADGIFHSKHHVFRHFAKGPMKAKFRAPAGTT